MDSAAMARHYGVILALVLFCFFARLPRQCFKPKQKADLEADNAE